VAAPDAKLDLAERERLMGERPGSELERRLAKLPDGHPSSSGYGDAAVSSERGDDNGEPDRVEPLTDTEWAEHLAEVETKLDKARAAGLTTYVQHTIDPANEFWSDEREKLHDEIVQQMYENSSNVPCERCAVLAGGLAGAGKTTVLKDHAGLDLSQYLVLNPDRVKEELARRGLIPSVDGLSPMEASDLAHEESSHITRRLATRALAEGRNVIWDVTMSRVESTEERIQELRTAGYKRIDGVFIDIPIEVSSRRAEARHREDQEAFRSGDGFGGRYITPSLILNQADEVWGSRNRGNFELVKEHFSSWHRYDNSIDGSDPVLVEEHRTIEDDYGRSR
jgi:predicted kinase